MISKLTKEQLVMNMDFTHLLWIKEIIQLSIHLLVINL